MSTPAKVPILAIDWLGAAVFGVCAMGCAYFVFFHGEHATNEIKELTSLVHSGSQDLATIRAARDRQHAVLEQRQHELDSQGQLPASISIEEYLQTLSLLATQSRVRVVRQNPLPSREYPGLLEQRYAYEVVGTMPDLAWFLKAVEDADLWADVAYLRIDGAQPQPGPPPAVPAGLGPPSAVGPRVSRDHRAALIVSLFSGGKSAAGGAADGG